MKIAWFILAITVGILGCDGPAFDNSVKKAIRAKLKDPDSAKFGNEIVVQTRACISVNAKNSYGGYTGATIAHLKNLGSDNWYVETFDGEPCYAHVLERKLEMDKTDEEKAEKERRCRPIARQCQDNAVKEDYSICMKRQGITDC
jgi:hypothetical protein